MIIGVFDSGRGGEVLATELQAAFANHTVITELDTKNVPYGLKTPDEIYALTKLGVENLVARGADIVVLACNTATTIIHRLRVDFSQPIVGLEPMVKPAAAQTKSGIIAVFATPATLASDNYQRLKATHASGIKVLEPDCGRWSTMIQHEEINWDEINTTVLDVIAQGADVLVLGCTHYHVLEDDILSLVGNKAVVLQPSEAVIAQIRTLIS